MYFSTRFFSLCFIMAMASALPYSYFLDDDNMESIKGINAFADTSKTYGNFGKFQTQEDGDKVDADFNEAVKKLDDYLDILHNNDFDLKIDLLFGKDKTAIGITIQNTPNSSAPELTQEEVDQTILDLFTIKSSMENKNDLEEIEKERFVSALKVLKQMNSDVKLTIESTGKMSMEILRVTEETTTAAEDGNGKDDEQIAVDNSAMTTTESPEESNEIDNDVPSLTSETYYRYFGFNYL